MGGVKLAHGSVFRCWHKPSLQAPDALGSAPFGQMAQHGCFYRSANDAATEQERVYFADIAFGSGNENTHDTVVAIAVFHANRINVPAGLGGSRLNLLFGIASGSHVELICLLRELGDAGDCLSSYACDRNL